MYKVLFLFLIIALFQTALAEPSEDTLPSYERQIVLQALSERGLVIDQNPEGKIIENFVVINHEAILPTDPWPEFLNRFHFLTEEQVIERELLLLKGRKWQSTTALETARNLRSYLFLSVAHVLAIRGSSDDKVVGAIITKDLWSLRLNTDFSYVGQKLEYLELNAEEANLLGKNKNLNVIYRMDPATYSFSENYQDPRLAGTRLRLEETGGVILNAAEGKPEGGSFQLSVGQPFYSLATETAWNIKLGHRSDIYRLFSSGQIAIFQAPSTGENIPISFNRRLSNAEASFSLSTLSRFKHELTAGWRLGIKNYELGGSVDSLQKKTREDFSTRFLPYSESVGSLFLRYDFFQPDFIRKTDINTFALTEDFRMGPRLSLETAFAHPALGGTSNFLSLTARAGLSQAFSDQLLSMELLGSTRFQPELADSGRFFNQLAQFTATHVSAPFGRFRLHTHAKISQRFQDLNRTLETLGANGGLRGYPSNYLRGPRLWNTNLELRSSPVYLHTIYLGGAAFVDLGDAYTDPSDFGLHGSIGLGIRILFPQFNRQVLRLDFGLPLENLGPVSPAYVVLQFGQEVSFN